MRYIYGPVFSRRLGRSLGVDLTPDKVCSFECLYCQVGKTPRKTVRRGSFVNMGVLRRELSRALARNPDISYITISGSGEPTLQLHLDAVIRGIRKTCHDVYPICVITNASLLSRKAVRRELLEADVVMPSLDAPDKKTFVAINRPHARATFRKVCEGLIFFRKEYHGRLWLEIMLLKGMNDSLKAARGFKRIIDAVRPDKVYLTIPLRPTPLPLKVSIPERRTIGMFKEALGGVCEVVVPALTLGEKHQKRIFDNRALLEALRRRPQTIKELASSLNAAPASVKGALAVYLQRKKVCSVRRRNRTYYCMA